MRSWSIRMTCESSCGITPILHDLCHSSSNATGWFAPWTKFVVRITLVPNSLNQWPHNRICFCDSRLTRNQVFPLLRNLSRSIGLVVDGILYLITIPLQPPSQVLRHVLHHKPSCQRIPQDWLNTIISSHHHETLFSVEDVKVRETGFLWEVGQLGGFCAVVVQESRGHFAGSFRGHTLGHHRHRYRQQQCHCHRKSLHVNAFSWFSNLGLQN